MKTVDERSKLLYQFLLIVLILSVIVVVFVKTFAEPQRERTLQLAMNTLAVNFSQRSLLLHNFWLMDGNKPSVLFTPSWLHLYYDTRIDQLGFKPTEVSFVMSENGWVKDVNGTNISEQCTRIWFVVLGKNTELYLENIKIFHDVNRGMCFYLTSSSGFAYNYNTGEVNTKVLK